MEPAGTARFQLRLDVNARNQRTKVLARLQAEAPAVYPETLLRTLQRRVKGWRAEVARELVFGSGSGGAAGSGREATRAAAAPTGVAGAATGTAV